jgi:Holliday junction resolvase-like predicted endonuclease
MRQPRPSTSEFGLGCLNPLFRVVFSDDFRQLLKNSDGYLEYNTKQCIYFNNQCKKYWNLLANTHQDHLLEREYFGKYSESYFAYNVLNYLVKKKIVSFTVYYSCDVTLKSNHYDRVTEIDLLFFKNNKPIAMVEVKSTTCGKSNRGFRKISRFQELIKKTCSQVVKLKEVFTIPCYVFLATINKSGNFALNCESSKVDFQKSLPRDVRVIENNIEELVMNILS